MRTEKLVLLETFLNYQDASTWMEHYVEGLKKEGVWEVIEAEIKLINHSWRAGLTADKKQKELDFDQMV